MQRSLFASDLSAGDGTQGNPVILQCVVGLCKAIIFPRPGTPPRGEETTRDAVRLRGQKVKSVVSAVGSVLLLSVSTAL